jgi:hypothetical protein
MPLLSRSSQIGRQHLIDPFFQRVEFRSPPLCFLSLWRYCLGERLPHHSPVHAILLRECPDRFAGCVFPPDLFK